jgi:hypothetical protein
MTVLQQSQNFISGLHTCHLWSYHIPSISPSPFSEAITALTPSTSTFTTPSIRPSQAPTETFSRRQNRHQAADSDKGRAYANPFDFKPPPSPPEARDLHRTRSHGYHHPRIFCFLIFSSEDFSPYPYSAFCLSTLDTQPLCQIARMTFLSISETQSCLPLRRGATYFLLIAYIAATVLVRGEAHQERSRPVASPASGIWICCLDPSRAFTAVRFGVTSSDRITYTLCCFKQAKIGRIEDKVYDVSCR